MNSIFPQKICSVHDRVACHTAPPREGALDVIRHAPVEVLIGLVARGGRGDPAQALCDAPDMRVHRELVGAQAEHENAGDGLAAHALEPAPQRRSW